MLSLDAYSDAVRAFAATALTQGDDQLELFVNALVGDPAAEACVDLRDFLATDGEKSAVSAYLEIGYFCAAPPERRLAWWLFFFEIGHAYQNIGLERHCEPYRLDQPLFRGAPLLFDHIRRRAAQTDKAAGSPDYELIDEAAVRSIEESEVFALNQGYGRLASSLRCGIVAWSRAQFPAAPRYLRLDPHFWAPTQPLMRLEEAAIAPADPRWMQTLALMPRMSSFAAYVLEDCDPLTDLSQCQEYRIGHIRRLEVIATRRQPDYLSMMIEELPRADAPEGLMVGHCIHLDTHAPVGTPMAQAMLTHLDLAINVYRGADRDARMADSLQHGKVHDATFRTHLYRIENIPFPSLFVFARLFLRSRTLSGNGYRI